MEDSALYLESNEFEVGEKIVRSVLGKPLARGRRMEMVPGGVGEKEERQGEQKGEPSSRGALTVAWSSQVTARMS